MLGSRFARNALRSFLQCPFCLLGLDRLKCYQFECIPVWTQLLLQTTVFARALPPSPDPSQFTFNKEVLSQFQEQNATLELQLRLIGGTLLPFNEANQRAVSAAVQNLVDSSIGTFLSYSHHTSSASLHLLPSQITSTVQRTTDPNLKYPWIEAVWFAPAQVCNSPCSNLTTAESKDHKSHCPEWRYAAMA